MNRWIKGLFVIVSISTLTLFSGCGVYDRLDFEKVKREIVTLKTTTISLSKIKEILDQEEIFGDLEDVDEKSLEELGISSEYIEKENGKIKLIFKQEKHTEINTIPMISYIVVKPAEDKMELLKEQIDAYYLNLLEEYNQKEEATLGGKEHLENVLKTEYEGYLIYILSNNNEASLKRIKASSHALLFEDTTMLSLKEFARTFSIDQKDVVEYQAVIPTKENSSSFYVIVRAKKGKGEKVKKQLSQYMKELEKRWSTYLPEEYELVKNRMETEVGSYFVYVVSKENEAVLNTIKNSIMRKDV